MPRKSLRAIPEAPTVEASARPTRRHAATLAARVLPLLNRPSHYYADSCLCATCRQRRTEPFVCRLCGYDGAPHMYPCGCTTNLANDIARLRATLARPIWTCHERLTRADASAALAALEAQDQHPVCEAGGPDCAHGARSCPVCGDHGDGEALADALELVAIIRDVRALLTAEAP